MNSKNRISSPEEYFNQEMFWLVEAQFPSHVCNKYSIKYCRIFAFQILKEWYNTCGLSTKTYDNEHSIIRFKKQQENTPALVKISIKLQTARLFLSLVPSRGLGYKRHDC